MRLRCRLCAAFVAAFSLAGLAVPATGAMAAKRQVIGHSVQGRPIVSVRSGADDAALKVLVVGAIHGNETAGMRIARRLIRAGAPRGAELTVVPTINPDGVAAGTRGNAHGVDLNRNFPYDWRPLGAGEYSGTGPLSEPESRAARQLILDERPDVTIWFHQPFGLIDRPRGNPFAARRFSELIGLPLHHLPGPYPGSASRWQNHTFPQSTAFVAELPPSVTPSLIRRGTTAVLDLASELASPDVRPHRRVATIGRTLPVGRAPDRRQDPPAGGPRP
ncbi:MAG: M14 family zinc carboxypeptidase [Solirubrobacterales bacterium]